jgi:hypothetical protein
VSICAYYVWHGEKCHGFGKVLMFTHVHLFPKRQQNEQQKDKREKTRYEKPKKVCVEKRYKNKERH